MGYINDIVFNRFAHKEVSKPRIWSVSSTKLLKQNHEFVKWGNSKLMVGTHELLNSGSNQATIQ